MQVSAILKLQKFTLDLFYYEHMEKKGCINSIFVSYVFILTAEVSFTLFRKLTQKGKEHNLVLLKIKVFNKIDPFFRA